MQDDKYYRILVVEDNYLTRISIVKKLEEYPQISKIDQAEDSKTAFHMIENNSYDICFLDLNLGNETLIGFEILKEATI